MNNRTNTTQGQNVEKWLADSLLSQRACFNEIKNSLGMPRSARSKGSPEVIGSKQKRKADVVCNFEGDYPPLRITVKSFRGKFGYNQIERRNIGEFCRRHQIPAKDRAFLERIFLRKAKAAEGRNTLLVEDSERDRVREIFRGCEIGISSLAGHDHPEIIAIFSMEKSKYHFYDVKKQVINLLKCKEVSFSPRSANIEFGKYIVLQRKGSAKGEQGSGRWKVTDIGHGANHVQIKMRTKKFFEEIGPIAYYSLSPEDGATDE